MLRGLLRRIALGIPVVIGPIVIAAAPSGLSGCGQDCFGGLSMTSRHVIDAATRARIGPGETIESDACRALCFELDGVTASDAGIATRPDAGVENAIDPGFARTSNVVCVAVGDEVEGGEILTCAYSQPVECQPTFGCGNSVAGRSPQALRAPISTRQPSAAAAFLAELAHLEAASVPAFDELAIELALHGAPGALIAAARRSADDERRHAATMNVLLAERGGARLALERGPSAPRSLAALTADNAIEGCGREAWGALYAAVQGARASDPAARAAFAAIARDEARHALLSFAIDDWARGRVGAAARRSRLDARRSALEALATHAATERAPEVRDALGAPDATLASELLSLVA